MIEGAEMYGLGNWADISEHVGGRTKEECKLHYEQTYLDSPDWPLPVVETDFSPTDVDTFAQLKKERLEELQQRPLPLPPPKPLASAPTCHEIGGYMPARLEFEHEFENEAEVLIKDLEFAKVMSFGGADQPATLPTSTTEPGSGEGEGESGEPPVEVKPTTAAEGGGDGADEEPEAELELKLSVLEMFNEKYDKRMMAKDLIFDRGLINYKIVRPCLLYLSVRRRSKTLTRQRRADLGGRTEKEQGREGLDHPDKSVCKDSNITRPRRIRRRTALYALFHYVDSPLLLLILPSSTQTRSR